MERFGFLLIVFFIGFVFASYTVLFVWLLYGFFVVDVLFALLLISSDAHFVVFGRLGVSFKRLLGSVVLPWIWCSVVSRCIGAGLLVSMLLGVMLLFWFLDLLCTLLFLMMLLGACSAMWSVTLFLLCTRM